MNLHLLRHAKTDQHSANGSDFDRSLLPKGTLQAQLMAKHLENLRGIATTWCSSAIRTRETLSKIKKEIELPDTVFLDELYLCSLKDYLDLIWSHKVPGDLFIVGHNFGISELATYLTDEEVELRTCEYVCIHFEVSSWQEISRSNGTIVDRYRPVVDL
jgi:phosphohistidine phosphatase